MNKTWPKRQYILHDSTQENIQNKYIYIYRKQISRCQGLGIKENGEWLFSGHKVSSDVTKGFWISWLWHKKWMYSMSWTVLLKMANFIFCALHPKPAPRPQFNSHGFESLLLSLLQSWVLQNTHFISFIWNSTKGKTIGTEGQGMVVWDKVLTSTGH